MSYQAKVLPETLLDVDTAGISGTYASMGTLTNPLVQVYISNFSDTDVILSRDGVNDHWAVPAGTLLELNIRGNSWNQQEGALPPSTIYIKGSSGTGFVYFGGMYQD